MDQERHPPTAKTAHTPHCGGHEPSPRRAFALRNYPPFFSLLPLLPIPSLVPRIPSLCGRDAPSREDRVILGHICSRRAPCAMNSSSLYPRTLQHLDLCESASHYTPSITHPITHPVQRQARWESSQTIVMLVPTHIATTPVSRSENHNAQNPFSRSSISTVLLCDVASIDAHHPVHKPFCANTPFAPICSLETCAFKFIHSARSRIFSSLLKPVRSWPRGMYPLVLTPTRSQGEQRNKPQ